MKVDFHIWKLIGSTSALFNLIGTISHAIGMMSTAERPIEQARAELYNAGMALRRQVMVHLHSAYICYANK